MYRMAGDDALHVRVLTVERLVLDKRWCSKAISSPYWRFYRNSNDSATIVLASGERIVLDAGRLHVIPAWVVFSCHCSGLVDHLFIHADLVGVPGIDVRTAFTRPLAIPLDAWLEHLCERIETNLDRPGMPLPAFLSQAKTLVYEALSRVFATLPPATAGHLLDVLSGDAEIAPAVRLIDDRYHQRLPNAYLAYLCGMSEDHFIRRFRRLMGVTPVQYIIQRRITAAAQRLLFSEEPIEHIATSCGFADRSYFSRIFTRAMGVSPAAFRAHGAANR